VSEQQQTNGRDAVGFFTVGKLLFPFVAIMTALLTAHTLVMKSMWTETIDERLTRQTVSRIEYDIRRAELEKAFTKMEFVDAGQTSDVAKLQQRVDELQGELRAIRERQERVMRTLQLK
jgi:hypothetical protein